MHLPLRRHVLTVTPDVHNYIVGVYSRVQRRVGHSCRAACSGGGRAAPALRDFVTCAKLPCRPGHTNPSRAFGKIPRTRLTPSGVCALAAAAAAAHNGTVQPIATRRTPRRPTPASSVWLILHRRRRTGCRHAHTGHGGVRPVCMSAAACQLNHHCAPRTVCAPCTTQRSATLLWRGGSHGRAPRGLIA